MPFAISLTATDATAPAIRALWERVGRLENIPSMAALGYPPHVTLGIYDRIEPGGRDEALAVFDRERPLDLVFDRIGIFENDPWVLWLAPAPSVRLNDIHARLHRLIDPSGCHSHYRPGAWVPHCTLGTRIEARHREAARAMAEARFEPLPAVFNHAEWVWFPPVSITASVALR